MNRLIAISLLLVVPFASGLAQDTGKTLAATLDVFVFPTEGQATDQQSKDEAECYSWATNNTGSDPFQLQKDNEAAQEQADQQAQQKAEQQTVASDQATEEQVGNFRKAFSVCLEAKDYMVKF